MMDSDLDDIVEDNLNFDLDEDQEIDNLEEAEGETPDNTEDDEQPTDDELEEEADPDGDEEDSESEAEADSEDETIFELPDGESITLSEIADLRANGLRDKDYRQKTTEVAEARKAVEAEQKNYAERSQFLETTLQSLTTYLEGLIPAEPPISLAQTNPNEYQYQKALRDASVGELTQLLQSQKNVKEAVKGFSSEDMQKVKATETEKLVKAMPHLSDPVKKAAFDEKVEKTAIEFGFSREEVAQAVDSRMFQLVHYASLGKQAELNRRNAKRRVQTPKKAPAKRGTQPADVTNNRKAMQRLSKTGSIEDALRIDFD